MKSEEKLTMKIEEYMVIKVILKEC